MKPFTEQPESAFTFRLLDDFHANALSSDEGTSTQEANLENILRSLYAELDNTTRAGYEEQALQENLKLKAPPTADHIDEYARFLASLTALTIFQESITHF